MFNFLTPLVVLFLFAHYSFIFLQTNNYQAILVTNHRVTYVLFNYVCGEMQWSGLGLGGAAVIGYNAEGIYILNHPSSGNAAVADIVSCGINQQKRRKRQENPFERTDMLELPTDSELMMRAEECIDLYLKDILLLQVKPMELADVVSDYPCPKTLNQAINDAGRYILYTQSPLCFVSSLPRMSSEVTGTVTISAAQLCCYENG